MCGITGFWDERNGGISADILISMNRQLAHRGPDDDGIWLDERLGIGLAHRRLSILDLSEAGHQPMHSSCSRYALTYNGEIYNYRVLRAALEKARDHTEWRGHSDTEALLAALQCWGTEATLKQLNGMFAFALWDAHERQLILARDRMGEKPLYYGRVGDAFIFGSELKALAAHPHWRGEVDREALAMYLRFGNVPTPWSIYKGIRKLPPAHFVVVREGGKVIDEPQSYWDLDSIAERGVVETISDSTELVQSLDDLLREAVKQRMAADVPLGAFLSGGFDSSTVTALMQAQSERPIKTFSVGFHEKSYNEAGHAKAVAKHLGTDHTELYVTPNEAMSVVPQLPRIYDEPFSDVSQIPTFLVSRLAREHVTVCLSGDGGDELFAGYNRHVVGPAVWNKVAPLPQWIRRGLGLGLAQFTRADLGRAMQHLRLTKAPNLNDKLYKLAAAFRAHDESGFYRALISQWKNPSEVVIGAKEPPTLLDCLEEQPDLPGLRERMMYLDMMTYLPDGILTKVDRASMSVGLEARVPLLDHRVVEFAWRVPTKFKHRENQGKWLLRQVLYRYVPRSLMNRPKMGFEVPIEDWLRGPLREWAEDLLDEKRLREAGFFDPAPIRRRWKEHATGKRCWHQQLWTVLMFQAWLTRRE